jgi:hypothetical protein
VDLNKLRARLPPCPVTIGSRWRMPHVEPEDAEWGPEEVWFVGALIWDGTEHTALCTIEGEESVVHLPAETLARTGTLIELVE